MGTAQVLPALGLVELDSIAAGIAAGDAMVKAAPVEAIYGGTVQPGRYLLLTTGSTASVEIAVDRAARLGAAALLDRLFLADVHRDVVRALTGEALASHGTAIGVLETGSVASVLRGADAGRKHAAVELDALKLADGIGGKGIALFSGEVGDVEAALERAADVAARSVQDVRTAVISQMHDEMRVNLYTDLGFQRQLRRMAGT
ncbi:MAG: BMC domain-containing protein [Arenicellales bacterium]